jgi:hypothetical protein
VIDLGDSRFDMNYGGCYASFENKTDGSGCGGKVQAREQCAYEACLAQCPLADDPNYVWADACVERVLGPGGQCESHALAAECTGDFEGTPAAICDWHAGDTYQSVYTRMAAAFCQ